MSALEFIELAGTLIFKVMMFEYEYNKNHLLQIDSKTLSIVSIVLRCSGIFIYVTCFSFLTFSKPFFGCFAFFYSVSVDNEYSSIIDEENLETSSIYQSSIELWSIGESIVALAVTVCFLKIKKMRLLPFCQFLDSVGLDFYKFKSFTLIFPHLRWKSLDLMKFTTSLFLKIFLIPLFGWWLGFLVYTQDSEEMSKDLKQYKFCFTNYFLVCFWNAFYYASWFLKRSF
jgi:hypothetical protein